MEWDDLRYVLAVGRQGALSAAARDLGVNHSTVFRRIGLIEERLGVRLFERRRDGCTPTPAGEEAILLAEHMEGDVDRLERRLAGRDTRPSGVIRVTTTDTLLEPMLAPMLAAFRDAQPDIRLEVIVDNRFFSLSKRDADVAIRPSTAPPETLVGLRVSAIATAIYGSAGYLEAAAPLDRPDAHDWIAPDDSLATLPLARWLRATLGQTEPVFRTNTLMGMAAAAKAGLGLAPLPCFLGDAAPELRRTHPPIDALASELWLLTHRDLQHVARVRVFLDFAHRALRRMEDGFEERSP
ncbi:MAG: LysR family transcriptional regulator [Alphaproteobacteria bacterium]